MIYDIADCLKNDLSGIISSSIENNNSLLENSGIKKLLEWHKDSEQESLESSSPVGQISESMDLASLILSTRGNRDRFFSKLSTMLVAKLLENIPLEFARIMVNNIQIKTQGKEQGVKFDIESEIGPIKPYVEFVKKINEVQVGKARITFQIDSKININGIEIMTSGEERRINLGRLIVNITVSILDTEMPILGGPKKLLDRTIESDLSEFHIQAKQKKDLICPAGHPNPPETKFCGICGQKIQN